MPSLLPDSRAPRLSATRDVDPGTALGALDALLLFVPADRAAAALDGLEHAALLRARLERSKRAPGAHFCVWLPAQWPLLVVVGLVPKAPTPFALLSLAGDMTRAAQAAEPASLGVAARGLDAGDAARALEAGASAAMASGFRTPRFSAKPRRAAMLAAVKVFGGRDLDARPPKAPTSCAG